MIPSAVFALLLASAAPLPIIDMHLHAFRAGQLGPPGQVMCAPYDHWPARDPRQPIEQYLQIFSGRPDCARQFKAPMTDDEIRNRSIAELERLNIVAVTSGDAEIVEQWRRQAPDRIVPALSFGSEELPSVAELRRMHAAGRLKVMGEIIAQYAGIAPNDQRLERYYAMAEELDIPVAIHVGFSAPGIAYFGAPKFRSAIGYPLLLEEVLLRHPKMRLYVMHAGYPQIDRMLTLMHAHPQVYVDTSWISYVLPRTEFRRYLRRLVEAGFTRRIMFGSDQMVWPDTIAVAVEHVESADFLTPQQKRDILYNNAAQFLRLSE